jgi:hypothetical protein
MEIPLGSRIISAETSQQLFGERHTHYQLFRSDGTPLVGGIFRLCSNLLHEPPGIVRAPVEPVKLKAHRELDDDEGWIRVESRRQRKVRRSLRQMRRDME